MALLDFLNPILSLPSIAVIILISAVVSVVTTVIYKYTTNQKLMKEIKEDVKRLQSEMKATKEPGKAAQLQKEMMKRSMQQLSSSTKSMLITILPLFLVFGWMNTHLAYEPISPGQEFAATAHFAAGTQGNITLAATEGMEILTQPSQEIKSGESSAAAWRLKAEKKGPYRLSYSFGNELYATDVIVTDKFEYKNPKLTKSNGIRKDSRLEAITVDLKPVQPLGGMAILGWKPGWLATYIIFSIAFSMLLRKWLKVY